MSHDLLFVDDDPVFLNRCEKLFADSPYQIHFLKSAEECLRLVQGGLDPVVLVASQSVLEVEGNTLFMQVQENKPVTQLIMVADSCDHSMLMQTINSSGLFRYYAKDGDLAELKKGVIAGVSLCLHRRQSLSAARSLVGSNVELEDSNYNLEQEIERRTSDLQKSNDENIYLNHVLKRTVRELEGRDRVLRHLLTVHKLDDTLHTILEVIDDVLAMSCGCIYVKDKSGMLQRGSIFPEECQRSNYLENSNLVEQAMESGRLEMFLKPESQKASVAVPIYKGAVVLGVIEVIWDNEKYTDELTEDELIENGQTIYTFSVHAAIAIADHNVSMDKSSWTKTLDDVLQDFME